MMMQTKEQSTRAATAHQSASTNHHRSFLIHTDRVSAKRHRTETSRDYTADQIMRLCHKTVKSVKRTLNTEHFVSLVQKKRSTHPVRRVVTRKSRISHHNSQKFTVSEITSSLTTNRNAKHRFF